MGNEAAKVMDAKGPTAFSRTNDNNTVMITRPFYVTSFGRSVYIPEGMNGVVPDSDGSFHFIAGCREVLHPRHQNVGVFCAARQVIYQRALIMRAASYIPLYFPVACAPNFSSSISRTSAKQIPT